MLSKNKWQCVCARARARARVCVCVCVCVYSCESFLVNLRLSVHPKIFLSNIYFTSVSQIKFKSIFRDIQFPARYKTFYIIHWFKCIYGDCWHFYLYVYTLTVTINQDKYFLFLRGYYAEKNNLAIFRYYTFFDIIYLYLFNLFLRDIIGQINRYLI